jgi:hypothetical protein
MAAPLFVYGTLRRGESAHYLLQSARFVAEGQILGQVVQHEGYPGLIQGESRIAGELFEIPDQLFPVLDHYEGPNYTRRLTEVARGGETVTAWVYWLATSPASF